MCPVCLVQSAAETSRSRPVADRYRTSFIKTTKGEVHFWLCLTGSLNSFACCLCQLDSAASLYCILLEEDALKTVLMVLLGYRGSCPAEWHPFNRRCVAPVSAVLLRSVSLAPYVVVSLCASLLTEPGAMQLSSLCSALYTQFAMLARCSVHYRPWSQCCYCTIFISSYECSSSFIMRFRASALLQ